MRILHVNTTSQRAGGAEGVMYDLQDWQREHGHQVGLFAGHTEEAEDSAERRVVVRPEWEATRLISDPELEVACGEFLGSFAPDVVHLHNLSSFPVRIVDVLARYRKG